MALASGRTRYISTQSTEHSVVLSSILWTDHLHFWLVCPTLTSLCRVLHVEHPMTVHHTYLSASWVAHKTGNSPAAEVSWILYSLTRIYTWVTNWQKLHSFVDIWQHNLWTDDLIERKRKPGLSQSYKSNHGFSVAEYALQLQLNRQ